VAPLVLCDRRRWGCFASIGIHNQGAGSVRLCDRRPASIRTFPAFFAARLKDVAIWHPSHSARKSKFSRRCANASSRSGRRVKHVRKTKCSSLRVRRENRSTDIGRFGFCRIAKPRQPAGKRFDAAIMELVSCPRNLGSFRGGPHPLSETGQSGTGLGDRDCGAARGRCRIGPR